MTPGTPPTPAELRRLLRERFDLHTFLPGQERMIRSLLQGRDVLGLLPTGGGKSLVYQLTAELLPGVTVVVSPLLALIKDQVESLAEHGVAAGVIDSTQSPSRAAEELQKVQQGRAKLLYVTPERFEDAEFFARLRRLSVALLVVDEAHCISEWGHSFRPAYLLLGKVAAELRPVVLLALTATASPWVRRDITDRLGMRDPDIVVHGLERPNLFLEVWRIEEEDDERRALERLLAAPDAPGTAEPSAQGAIEDGTTEDGAAEDAARQEALRGSGIIYTATTRGAAETAKWLRTWGIPADYYHGRRRKSERGQVQEAFMGGELRVIAATNAFGLGVDKPDVRFVIHRDVPASVEAYYQEAGRAGRDGAFARCLLLYRPADLGRAAFLAGTGHVTREDVRRVHAGLRSVPPGAEITRRDLVAASGVGSGDLVRLLDRLSRDGIVAERRGRIRLRVPDFDPEQVSLEGEERRLAYERSRVEMMRAYAELHGCRHEYILNYFGQEYDATACTMCDNCLGHGPHHRAGHQAETAPPAALAGAAAPAPAPFSFGDRVRHEHWGEGVVQRLSGDVITVLFDDAGYKTLSLPGVVEHDLLRRLPS
ncbi:MAG TPA: RecQ family ATP-dependent DNA helicase [Chloroflexota bacterium]|nr:RecQ family ATP-dependent DNA helicase [Chloroflexota bacterium]